MENITLEIYKEKEKIKAVLKTLCKITSNILNYLNININLVSIFDLIKNDDFKDIVICFDDLERKNNNLQINDFLGLISNLKEQKNCHVVLIFNIDKLDDKIFNVFSEKCIDLNLDFNPSIKDLFEIDKKEISIDKYFNKETVLSEFEKIELKNLRTIFYIFEALNDFAKFMKNQKFYDKNKILINLIKSFIICKEFTILSDIEKGKFENNERRLDIFDVFINFDGQKSNEILKNYLKKNYKSPNLIKNNKSQFDLYYEYFVENRIDIAIFEDSIEYFKCSCITKKIENILKDKN
ncbi:hypothetical protein CSPB12327_03605 [Campylobacter sp. RM12327]|uniref:hypothetical protein n=1 Tax=Campylobacter sputorum TaxID=206 RepID=UPI00125EBDD3|nr:MULTISPECIES: hypothetical protein [Campylobacter]MBE7357583.1 hypothetical protein [Campylobacter sp. RM11302]MBF6669229.1 hypothetical protein [Campylobacter sp. RM12327]MBF6674498.1 hypothetical protein [Campylobacter sp. RM13538]MBF6677095.1 hypothetical protein [Campylobacter sp. RM11259]